MKVAELNSCATAVTVLVYSVISSAVSPAVAAGLSGQGNLIPIIKGAGRYVSPAVAAKLSNQGNCLIAQSDSEEEAQERANEAEDQAKQARDQEARAEWEAQEAEKHAEEAEQRAKEAEERSNQDSGW